MNKKEIEKIIDNAFSIEYNKIVERTINEYAVKKQVKDFILNKIIPESIKSVCDVKWEGLDGWKTMRKLHKNAKELFNVHLI